MSKKQFSKSIQGNVLSMDSFTHRSHFPLQEPELRLVKYLPEILALQRDLVRLFQNSSDVKRCTIREFLSEPLSGEKMLPKLRVSETQSA